MLFYFNVFKMEFKSTRFSTIRTLEGHQKSIPYVIVDYAFVINENIKKAYSGAQVKGSAKRRFNYRLSHVQRTENVFGKMSAVFRVLKKP